MPRHLSCAVNGRASVASETKAGGRRPGKELHSIFKPCCCTSVACAVQRIQCSPVHSVDFSHDKALQFLAMTGCDATRSNVVFGLLGGHLSHLMFERVSLYCSGEIDAAALADRLTQRVDAMFDAVDGLLECRPAAQCACSAICAVIRKEWDSFFLASPGKGLLALMGETLINWSSLRRTYVVGAPFHQSYVQHRCGCILFRCTRWLRSCVIPIKVHMCHYRTHSEMRFI